MTSAEVCRRNEWGPGTFIVNEEYGDEGVLDVVRITAVGERLVLGADVGYWKDGTTWRPLPPIEETRRLTDNNWRAVRPGELPPSESGEVAGG